MTLNVFGQIANSHTMTIDEAANICTSTDVTKSSVSRQNEQLACQMSIQFHALRKQICLTIEKHCRECFGRSLDASQSVSSGLVPFSNYIQAFCPRPSKIWPY